MRGAALAILVSLLGALLPGAARAQSTCQYIQFDAVLTPAEWSQCFENKQDFLGYTPLNPANVVGAEPITSTTVGTTITLGFDYTHAGTFTAMQQVDLNVSILQAAQAGTVFRIANVNGTNTRYEADAYAATAHFTGLRADGTAASPTTLQSGDNIASFNAFGYDGSAFVGPQAAFRCYAAQNWTTSALGTYCDIAVTANGATAEAETVRFENDGGVTLPSTVTGGDKGAGTINAAGLYVNGTAVSTGGASIASAAANDLAYYTGTAAIGGLATADNGVLITGSSGVPSISTTLPSGLTVPSPTLSGTTSLNNLSAIEFSANFDGAFLLGGETANLVEIGPSPSATSTPTNLLLQPPSGAGAYLVISATDTATQSQMIIGNNGTGASPGDYVVGETIGAGGSCYPIDFANAVPTIAFTMTCDPHLQIKNNVGIWGRNAANNADIEMMNLDGSNNLQIGASGANSIVLNKATTLANLFTLTGTESNQLEWSLGGQVWKINVTSGSNWYVYDNTNGKIPFVIAPDTSAVINIGEAAANTVTMTGSVDFSGTATFADSSTYGSSGISGTTINNSAIGGATAAAGTFTTLTSTGQANLGTGSTDYLECSGGSSGANCTTNGGTFTLGADGAKGLSFATSGALTAYNQPTTGSISYAVCAASGANGTGGGAIILDTSATICGLSAARFKNLMPEDAISPRAALAAVVALRTEPWRYRSEYQDGGDRVHVSLIADDVAAMNPDCAEYDPDGAVRNYDDRCVEAYLVAAVKELREERAR